MHSFDYRRVQDVPAAIGAGQEPGAFFIAGGTNLLDLLKYNVMQAGLLVDVNDIADCKRIEPRRDGSLWLGAMVSNAATAWHELVEARYPLLSKAILAGASAQIRNMATNGGNLLQRTRCYYFYDAALPCNKRLPGSGCPALAGQNRMMAVLGASEHCIAVYPSDMSVALAALEAEIQVVGPRGVGRTIPIADFHRLPGDTPHIDHVLEPGDLIRGIVLPPQGFPNYYNYLKIRDRSSYAFALVSVATAFELEKGVVTAARIALGGVAHKPWRVRAAEQFLVGRPVTAEALQGAAALLLEGARGYGQNDFKIELARRAIVRSGLMALDPSTQQPGAQPSL